MLALEAELDATLLALAPDLEARTDDLEASTLATEEAELRLDLASAPAIPTWLRT